MVDWVEALGVWWHMLLFAEYAMLCNPRPSRRWSALDCNFIQISIKRRRLFKENAGGVDSSRASADGVPMVVCSSSILPGSRIVSLSAVFTVLWWDGSRDGSQTSVSVSRGSENATEVKSV